MAERASDAREPGLWTLLAGDGCPLIAALALALMGAGLFACFQAATGHLLPHDEAWLGMTAADLRQLSAGRVLLFMIHDRVAFGGALISVGVMYLYLSLGPLRRGERWAWHTLLVSGLVGFLTWLGHGYLDTWHGVATVGLGPLFSLGLARSLRHVRDREPPDTVVHERAVARLWRGGWSLRRVGGVGRGLLLLTAACVITGGLIIMGVGVTTVFVPTDLAYMGLTASELDVINPRLVPLIAHDRAGFGGAVCSAGVAMFGALAAGRPEPALWQAVGLAMLVGFGSAIVVHFPIGYTSFAHLGPAYLGAGLFAVGWLLSLPAAAAGELDAA